MGESKKSGINYAMAKVTGGVSFQDDKFINNWVGMKNNDIKAGAYHYFRASQDHVAQISNIQKSLSQCGFDVSKDILAIDVEEKLNEIATPDEMADGLWEVTEGLKNINFQNIHIYCSPNYWNDKVAWKNHDFSVFPLWIAHRTTAEEPRVPTTWQEKGWVWWQYSDKGKVDGILGDVDLDHIKLTGIVEEYSADFSV